MTEDRRGGQRGPFDIVNPVDLIVDWIIWQARWAGARVITGVVLLAALGVVSIGFAIPFVLAYLVISVFGLAVEPYKWIGSILIVAAFVSAIAAIPLILRRMILRSRRILAYTMFEPDVSPDGFRVAPSRTVSGLAASRTREEWAAGIRALDERLATRDTAVPPRS